MKKRSRLLLLLLLFSLGGCMNSMHQLYHADARCQTKECFERELGKANEEGLNAAGTRYVMVWAGRSGDRVHVIPGGGGARGATYYVEDRTSGTC